MKEYKGEKAIAGIKARLIPPASQYPDSMCELMLTERHLYIMDNGTSEPIFTIFIERIRDMEAQLKGAPYKRSALGEMLINGTAALVEGITSSGKKKEDDGIRLVITFDDGMGSRKKLYFKDLQSNPNRFIKTYHELFQPLDG